MSEFAKLLPHFPQSALLIELQDRNARGIWCLLNNQWTEADVSPR